MAGFVERLRRFRLVVRGPWLVVLSVVLALSARTTNAVLAQAALDAPAGASSSLATPSGEITSVNSSSVTVGLAAGSPTSAQGLVVYRSTQTGSVAVAGCPTTDPALVTCTDTGLAPGNFYQYRVFAYAAGVSTPNPSPMVTRTPGGLPVAPTASYAIATSGSSVQLGWADNSADETGFRVYRLLAGVWSPVGVAAANATSFTDSTAPAASLQVYLVSAFNSFGERAADSYEYAIAWGGPIVGAGAPDAPSDGPTTPQPSLAIWSTELRTTCPRCCARCPSWT
jgi:hypothetical protein